MVRKIAVLFGACLFLVSCSKPYYDDPVFGEFPAILHRYSVDNEKASERHEAEMDKYLDSYADKQNEYMRAHSGKPNERLIERKTRKVESMKEQYEKEKKKIKQEYLLSMQEAYKKGKVIGKEFKVKCNSEYFTIDKLVATEILSDDVHVRRPKEGAVHRRPLGDMVDGCSIKLEGTLRVVKPLSESAACAIEMYTIVCDKDYKQIVRSFNLGKRGISTRLRYWGRDFGYTELNAFEVPEMGERSALNVGETIKLHTTFPLSFVEGYVYAEPMPEFTIVFETSFPSYFHP